MIAKSEIPGSGNEKIPEGLKPEGDGFQGRLFDHRIGAIAPHNEGHFFCKHTIVPLNIPV
jgi:hypothetical protein